MNILFLFYIGTFETKMMLYINILVNLFSIALSHE